MIFRTGFFRITLIVMMFLILAQTSWAVDASRIQLRDGKVYRNVTFEVDSRFKVIVIHVGDMTRNVSFPDVELILDEVGHDVTARYVGEQYSLPGHGDQGGGTAGDSHSELPYAIMFGVNGTLSVPIGEYYQRIKPGIGFGGNVRIPVSRKLAVRVGISKSGMKVDNAYYSPDVDFDAWRYYGGLEYYKWPRWQLHRRTMPYFFCGLGAITNSLSYDRGALIRSKTKFIITVGGGAVAMLEESLGLDFTAVTDLVVVGNDAYGDAQYAMVLDLRIGLVTAF